MKCDRSGARGTMSSSIDDVPPAERVAPRPQPGRRDGVGHDDAPVLTRQPQIVAERDERHVRAVGDETDPQFGREAEHPLHDVVVTVQLHRAPVADVREHRQARVDGAAQLVERGIGVARRIRRSRPVQHRVTASRASRSGASVTMRVEPRGGVEQPLHRLQRPPARMASRGCAPRYPSASLRNGPSMCRPAIRRWASGSRSRRRGERREPAAHRRHVVGDDRREERRRRRRPRAVRTRDAGRRRSVRPVEVDAGVAVDLQIYITAH